MSSSSSWLPTFGLVQKTRGRHSRASRLDHLGFADDVRFAAQTNHFVPLVFQLEQSRSTFVVFGVFGTAGARKPVVLSVGFDVHVSAKALHSLQILCSHLGFDDILQVGAETAM